MVRKLPSGPMGSQTELLLEEVASRDPSEYVVFLQACEKAARPHGDLLYVNVVREFCSRDGRLTIMPQRFSAYYYKAQKEGYMERTDQWETCKGSTSGNDGRPQPVRRWLRKSVPAC